MNDTKRRSFFRLFLTSLTTLGFGIPLLASAKPLKQPHNGISVWTNMGG